MGKCEKNNNNNNKKKKQQPSELKIVRKVVARFGGPFRENPQVYAPQPPTRTHGNSKQYFSVLIQENCLLLFTYDDSEEFLPIFVHFFDVGHVRYSMWSPLGSSLLCIRNHELIVLSAGPAFEQTTFHADGLICDAGFSPQENFLFLLREPSPNEQYVKLEIRETKTGNIRKAFDTATITESCLIGRVNFLKWDAGDNYIASLETNRVVIIYETKTFSRIKPIIFKHVRNFDWSPSASVLAVFADSYIKVVDICSGKEFYKIGWKGADQCKLFWERSGDYVACMCTGIDYKRVFLVSLKSGKGRFVTPRGNVIDFAWRGNGKDFAVTQVTEDGKPTRVKFYTINEDEITLRKRVETVEDMIAHFLHWSPNGEYMVMQGPWDSGELYFYNVNNHQRLTSTIFISFSMKWDTTSRFFLTQAHPKNWRDQVVRIWSPHGVKLIDVGPLDLHVLWGSNQTSIAGSSMDVDVKEESLSFIDGDKTTGKRPANTSGDLPSHLRMKFDHGC